jgi:hypothetical protein
MPLNQNDLARLSAAAGALVSVLQVDSVWTSLATAPGQAGSTGAATLPAEIMDTLLAMRQAIDEAVQAGQAIRDVVGEVLERDPAFADLPQTLTAELDSAGDQLVVQALQASGNSLVALADSGYAAIRSSRSEAMEMLLSDLQHMLNGVSAAGYLPRQFLCGLAKLSMAAGLVTVWVPPHAHAAAAVGLGAAVYKGTRCSELEPGGRKRPRTQHFHLDS